MQTRTPLPETVIRHQALFYRPISTRSMQECHPRMLELSQHIGFRPINNFHTDQPLFDLYNGRFTDKIDEKYLSTSEVSAAISMIDHMGMEGLPMLSYSKELRNDIIDDMVTYYQLHIEQFRDLKTIDVLRTIFG